MSRGALGFEVSPGIGVPSGDNFTLAAGTLSLAAMSTLVAAAS
jgi:hypothetical protein